MSGSYPHFRLHLALGLLFGAVLATGAATGAWGSEGHLQQPVASHQNALPVPRISSDDAALRWVAQSGDRWSALYTAQQFASVTEALAGHYAGVGLWVTRSPDGSVSVSRVRPDGPAAQAAVGSGDRLLRIDGREVTGLPVTEVVALLRGTGPSAGSAVRLGLLSRGRVHDVVLHRQLLDADDVVVDHPDAGITRIVLSAFTAGTGDQVVAAVRERRVLPGGERGKGILLDLRGNSGGLVDEAVASASAFLDGGPVASYRADDGEPLWLTAARGGDSSTPLVVLVDGGTMSAAELLTGALQDRGRAVVVGSRTFGKAAVQQPTTLPSGAVLERTVGHYRTPAGRDLDGAGITPDVLVPPAAGPQAAERTAITVLDDLAGVDSQ
ncbi:carboxyl-terminal processing protease [Streptacidiphilus sp. MAP12-16]|uniref:S41 family peptidase n=1 Tax=Streptacidiphilus sp. MAP12-16 TaxID=3156300 RepID=UPI003518B478